MRQLDLTVFEPGDTVGTMSADGKVCLWTVNAEGCLVSANHRLFGNPSGVTSGDDIEVLKLSTRSFNILKREKVNTVGELLSFWDLKGEAGLSAMRSITGANVSEIRSWVEELRSQR
jgi:DNA-directed RNA polymerase alpha subunit